jgi:hypothetical protein
MLTSRGNRKMPRRALETVVAYLRLGCADGGLAIDVKGGYSLTPELREIIARGDMAIMRADRSSRRRNTTVHTVPQGIDRLADYDNRFGEAFAPGTIIPRLKADRARR